MSKTVIQDEWRESDIGQIASVQNGYAFKSGDFSSNGIYVIKIKNVASGAITFDDISFYNGDTEKLEKFFIENGDILVSMTGSHISQLSSAVGKVAIYKSNKKALLNQRVGNIKPKNGVDKKYLSFLLLQPSVQLFWGNKAGGSANQANISPDIIKSYSFLLPPLSEQKAIAAVLSSLDDKIELLREQNKTLEDIAQAIFQEWFECGEDIDTVAAKEYIDFEKGIEVGSKNYFEKQEKDYVPFFRVGDIGKNGNESKTFVDPRLLKKGTFQEKDILISFDGTVGRVFVGGFGGYSSGIRKIVTKNSQLYSDAFLYFWANSKTVQKTIDLYSEGTTIMHAGKSIEHLKLPTDENLLDQFNRISFPVFKKLTSNISQIKTLSTLRDTLLPKLMKGDVRVKNFNT